MHFLILRSNDTRSFHLGPSTSITCAPHFSSLFDSVYHVEPHIAGLFLVYIKNFEAFTVSALRLPAKPRVWRSERQSLHLPRARFLVSHTSRSFFPEHLLSETSVLTIGSQRRRWGPFATPLAHYQRSDRSFRVCSRKASIW